MRKEEDAKRHWLGYIALPSGEVSMISIPFRIRSHRPKYRRTSYNHVLAHPPDVMVCMEEVWEIARPGLAIDIRVPSKSMS